MVFCNKDYLVNSNEGINLFSFYSRSQKLDYHCGPVTKNSFWRLSLKRVYSFYCANIENPVWSVNIALVWGWIVSCLSKVYYYEENTMSPLELEFGSSRLFFVLPFLSQTPLFKNGTSAIAAPQVHIKKTVNDFNWIWLERYSKC